MGPEDRSPVAVVTGASSGIGQAVAARLLADGWRVIGLSRSEPDLVSRGLDWRQADLTDPASAARAVEDLVRVEALVHAAGLQTSAPLATLRPEAGDAMYAVHVSAAVHLAHALEGRLVDGGR